MNNRRIYLEAAKLTYKYMYHSYDTFSYQKMKVRIDVNKVELIENIGSRRDVTLQLVARAISLKLREYKESNRREAIIVWIDVHQPAISVLLH